MLQISAKQMAAFRVAARQRFEMDMLRHLSVYAERLHAIHGDAPFVSLIREGIDRAQRYGLTKRGPVQLFLELMCSFGWRFDSDPQLPWVHRWLADTCEDQMALAQALRGDALRYIDELIGANGEVALTSFYALRLSFPPRRNAHFGIERYLESIGSGKSRVAGASGISELRTAARELCAARGLEHSVAESSVVALMFVCGHGIHDDPLYPWVSATLARPGTTEERIDRLERKALHYLDATIAYWEQSVTPKQGG